MKIIFPYTPYLFRFKEYFDKGKKFNWEDLYNDPSGLTGSELSCFTIAQVMAKRGHDVSILARSSSDVKEIYWGRVRIIPMRKQEDIGVLGGDWDVVYAWNEIDALRFATHSNTLKMLNLQINDVDHALDGFLDYVDVFTSPSESHRKIIGPRSGDISRWEVVPNGCDPSIYTKNETINGRVIYASSPDRGLHWLLQSWPKIKKQVPHAHLKIFYEIKKWMDPLLNAPPINRDVKELSTRARWIKEAMYRLDGMDIEVIGSVSRNRIAEEFNKAQVLAYPCDTINYTEGFSVTLMEACASGTIPVTTSVDALGEIYGGAIPVVEAPIGQRLDEWSDIVIHALKSPEFRSMITKKASVLANQYEWSKIVDKIERIVKERK